MSRDEVILALTIAAARSRKLVTAMRMNGADAFEMLSRNDILGTCRLSTNIVALTSRLRSSSPSIPLRTLAPGASYKVIQ
jgi:hypothetical protein